MSRKYIALMASTAAAAIAIHQPAMAQVTIGGDDVCVDTTAVPHGLRHQQRRHPGHQWGQHSRRRRQRPIGRRQRQYRRYRRHQQCRRSVTSPATWTSIGTREHRQCDRLATRRLATPRSATHRLAAPRSARHDQQPDHHRYVNQNACRSATRAISNASVGNVNIQVSGNDRARVDQQRDDLQGGDLNKSITPTSSSASISNAPYRQCLDQRRYIDSASISNARSTARRSATPTIDSASISNATISNASDQQRVDQQCASISRGNSSDRCLGQRLECDTPRSAPRRSTAVDQRCDDQQRVDQQPRSPIASISNASISDARSAMPRSAI